MSSGANVLLAVMSAATAFGCYRRRTDGTVRHQHEHVNRLQIAKELGAQATLVQISSQFCTQCQSARKVLQEVALTHAGVTHLEIDGEDHLDLLRELGVMRTPTTLVLDENGSITSRIVGLPRIAEVHKALAEAGAATVSAR